MPQNNFHLFETFCTVDTHCIDLKCTKNNFAMAEVTQTSNYVFEVG